MLKTRLAQLRSTYTDNWPEIAELKLKIDVLESEKRKLNSELETAQKTESAKHEVINKISEDEKNLGNLKKKLETVEKDLKTHTAPQRPEPTKKKDIPEKDVPKKERASGYIITPATYRRLPEFKTRLLIGLPFGILVWFLIACFLCRLFRRKAIYL